MMKTEFHKTENQILDELQEVEAAQKDPSRFEVLYNRYHEPIFRYIYSRVDNKHLASEIVSQTFYKALLNLENYTHKGLPFSSWLYRIAYNEMNMHFRKDARSRTVNVETEQLVNIMEEIEEDFFSEHKERLASVLAALDEEKLNLIEMRFFQKLSFKEIADITGITENNAKVKVYRTLDRIKKDFKVGV